MTALTKNLCESVKSVDSFGAPGRLQSPRLQSEPIHQLPRELGALSLFLVLEVDEGVFPLRLVLADHVSPAVEIRRLVALVAQPEVAVAGRGDHGRGACVAVGDAEGEVSRPQP